MVGKLFILEYLSKYFVIIQLVVDYKSEVVPVPPLDPWARLFMSVDWLAHKFLIIINERLVLIWLVAEF